MNFIFNFWPLAFILPFVPLIIHLINLMRHRRVEWGAMEFLLKSYKKHSSSVWLMQLLLLLLRMGIVALIVIMLAGLVTPQWTVGQGRTTHHYVLLDDSYSMSDRVDEGTVFDRASEAVQAIVDRVANDGAQAKFTLIRFSRAASASNEALQEGNAAAIAGIADFNAAPVDREFGDTFLEAREQMRPSELSVGPAAALSLAETMISQSSGETPIVHLVSDFRRPQWEQPTEVRTRLQRLNNAEAQINFIASTPAERQNLAITVLRPQRRTRAAGVPLFMDIHVRNYGTQRASNVEVVVEQFQYPEFTSLPDNIRDLGVEPVQDSVVIDSIEPGATAVTRKEVYFETQGTHVVRAELPSDAVAADNERFCVVDFPDGVPVLVVDGPESSEYEQNNYYFLGSVFRPSVDSEGDSTVATGVTPVLGTVSMLRDSDAETLSKYHAIYLANVPELDVQSVANLKAYVEAGGGLAIFLGEDVKRDEYNQDLFRSGLLPMPLAKQIFLSEPINPETPHFTVDDHPAFRVFTGERNSNLRRVKVFKFVAPPKEWSLDPDGPVKVVARLHNRDPLVLEKRLGQGRVLQFNTTAEPDWNNWARDPSYIVAMLELQSYLAGSRQNQPERLVGSDLTVSVGEDFETGVEFVTPPPTSTGRRQVIERQATKPQEDSELLFASLGDPASESSGLLLASARQGVYEAWLLRSDGVPDVRRWTLNVDPSEGELKLISREQLTERLEDINFRYLTIDEISQAGSGPIGTQWTQWLLLLLILFLLGEQVFALYNSFHPPQKHPHPVPTA